MPVNLCQTVVFDIRRTKTQLKILSWFTYPSAEVNNKPDCLDLVKACPKLQG